MFSFWINILEQGLIFGVLALGVYITYKILDFPDLSVDGTFPLGAAVAASTIFLDINPLIATFLAFVCGMLAGFFTGILHVKLKITNLLSGILVMSGLYSLNLRIMGKSNIPLFNKKTIFSYGLKPILIGIIFVVVLKLLLDFLLKTKFGFLLRAVGDNPQVATSLGVNIGSVKIIGLMLSNGLVALSGALMAQYQSFSDIGMGTGVMVMGLASVILGKSVFNKISLLSGTSVVVLGAILYKASTAFAMDLGFPPTDLKLITVVIVLLSLSIKPNSILKLRKPIRTGVITVAASKKSM